MNKTDDVKNHFEKPHHVADHGGEAPGGEAAILDYANTDWEKAFWFLRQRQITEMVVARLRPGSRILEVGCGVGELISGLARRGYACTGLDISTAMIEQARQREAARPSGITWLTGDVVSHDAPPYDAVIANGVICYYAEQRPFLEKIRTLLSPDGVAVISHRNRLFNLVALNAGTVDFLETDLLAHLPAVERERALTRLRESLPGMTSPIERSSNHALMRTAENPLTVSAQYVDCGFRVEEIVATCIHPLPPRLTDIRRGEDVFEVTKRYERSWQGLFLGSQFIVGARRAD